MHRHRRGREDADRAVAHLPAVAVRAVQHVAAPPLAQPGDRRQLVDEAGRDEQAAGPRRPAVGEGDREPLAARGGAHHLTADDRAAVAPQLRPPALEQLGRGDALPPQQRVHAGRRGVAGFTGVHHDDRAARPRERDRRR